MYNKLKELRMKNNYTSKDMANKLSISKPYYSQIENEVRGLSYDMAFRIASVFNLKPDEIFYDEYKQKEDKASNNGK